MTFGLIYFHNVNCHTLTAAKVLRTQQTEWISSLQ